MEERKPSFYLSSAENNPAIGPRECFILQKLKSSWQAELLLVRVDPPLTGLYWTGESGLNEVVLANKGGGDIPYPLTHGFVSVHVCRIVNQLIISSGEVSADDIQSILWAELYPTREEAEASLGYLDELGVTRV
jgi:hypothetical protein